MSLGMSYKDYWEGENRLPFFWLRAESKRCRRQLEEQNMAAWLNGFYNMQALSVTLANAFGKSCSIQAEYPGKPMELFGNGKQTRQISEEEQEQAEMAVEIALDNFVSALGGRRRNG